MTPKSSLNAANERITSTDKEGGALKPVAKMALKGDLVAELETNLEKSFRMLMRQVHLSILQLAMRVSTSLTQTKLGHFLRNAVNARGERVKPLAPGTRLSIINRLVEWGNSNDTHDRIFWLNDEAGTGKSSIAAHMANKWREEGALGARFFFDRSGGRDLWNLGRFCTTLAKEMSDNHPLAHALYFEMLPNTPDLEDQSFTDAFNLLVVSVAEQLGKRTPTPLIFVIDALDECDVDDVPLLVDSVFESLSRLPAHVRFLLTSRPTMEMKAILGNLPNVGGKDAVLLDVRNGDFARDHDIMIYVQHTLKQFSVTDQNTIIQCASGVFLWAFLACETLLRTIVPKKTLSMFENKANNPTMQILYEAALEAALPVEPSPHTMNLFRSVLQGVVLPYTPVSIFSVQSFFPHQAQETVQGDEYVDHFVKKLGSIMKDGTPFLPIHILHPTFREFIEDQRHGTKFYIAPPIGHYTIAIASLAILTKNLCSNVLGLDDGKSPLPTYVPPEFEPPIRLSSDIEAPLRYAVAYWAKHGSLAVEEDDRIQIIVQNFFKARLLLWIEWASAIQALSECIESLRQLRRALQVQVPSKENTLATTWCSDALRFLLKNSPTIEKCGLQAWMSALVFTPKHSLVYQTFSTQSLRPLPLLLTPYEESSNSSWILLQSKGEVLHSEFSPDGKRILSHGITSGSLRLWNVKRRKVISRMKGGHNQKLSVAKFSPDGSLIVSGSEDGVVCVWDGFTGALKERLPLVHKAAIYHLVFGLGNSCVVGVDEDNKMWRWLLGRTNAALDRAKSFGTLHTGEVVEMFCSPNSRVLATFSTDKSIRLWDLETCAPVGEPMICTSSLASGSFSRDGEKIVAGHTGGTVTIWNAASRTLVHSLETGLRSAHLLAVPPKGNLVAVADKYLCLIDISKGEEVCPRINERVSSLAFDDSGNRLIIGSWKNDIIVCTMRSSEPTITLERADLKGHTHSAASVCSILNGRLVLSSSPQDGTLRIWDTDLLNESDVPVEKPHETVKCVAGSNDGTYFISAGENGTFQMWDFASGQKIRGAFRSDQGEVTRLLFSSTNNSLWASAHSKGKVSVWHGEGEDEDPTEYKLDCDEGYVKCMAFTDENTYLATGHHTQVILLWELASHSCIAKYTCTSTPDSITFSHDGRYLASTFPKGGIQLRDVQTHQVIEAPEGVDQNHSSRDVDYVAFSPNGRSILLRQSSSFRLFDMHDSMRCYALFTKPHELHIIDPVWRPVFTADSAYVVYWKYTFHVEPLLQQKDDYPKHLVPCQGPNVPERPTSPLRVNKSLGLVYSVYWPDPILRIPADVRVTTWVAHGNTIGFGSSDGRVFVLRFPEVGPWK
ncbi:hypothetical protein M408DRAFT_294008 [Serendipita vermifera MAFF 305830]|uniref:NACHT domain-containing protein n=1 Tax=Serendipita vermifera MAFF 305830 TaxID=933852 RepID=A0A0C3ABM7_SERVB|nr:hypothetical protein M408DRAFT_294008 [Serendipita vermifera MAFF 305830]